MRILSYRPAWPVVSRLLHVVAVGIALALASPDPLLASPAWFKSAFYLYPTAYQPRSVAAADLTGDGRTDAVLACYASDCISVMFSNTDGGYGPAVNVAAGHGPTVVLLADMNADGASDIVSTGESGDVYVLLNDGSGSFTQTAAVPALVYGTRALAVGDVNGDGKLDVMSYGAFFAGNGSGGLSAGAMLPGAHYDSETIALCDADADSKLDLLTGGNNGTFRHGNGDGTFNAPASITIGSVIATGDMNEDGKPDVVGATSSSVTVRLGNGAGGFASPYVVTGIDANISCICLGDVNNDGHLDVMAVHFGGGAGVYLSLYIGNGSGQLSVQKVFFTGTQARAVALAAPSAGAPLWAFVAEEGANALGVHPGNGLATFSIPPLFNLPYQLKGFAFSRVNADDRPDLIGWAPNTSFRGFYWNAFTGGANFGSSGNRVGDFSRCA